ncbi:hypothetical protein ACM41_13980 [Bradyrhizobium sp. CCBAU 21362]|uniref:helix-turn-helix domain-containing protein n=1 Tax=Bradyrhizobium sp. CCBAU 21362 TaxID=1325082 RepID=UPI003FA42AE5|nr:hypothetical protein [Bradyrhizobium sp. CCBAU 21362]
MADQMKAILRERRRSRDAAARRAPSLLPALLDYVLTRPVVSAGMISKEMRITPRAAQDLVAKLGLREATGRGRYRAWGILWDRRRPGLKLTREKTRFRDTKRNRKVNVLCAAPLITRRA